MATKKKGTAKTTKKKAAAPAKKSIKKPAVKSTAKKKPVKKTAVKKAPVKKAPVKKATPKKVEQKKPVTVKAMEPQQHQVPTQIQAPRKEKSRSVFPVIVILAVIIGAAYYFVKPHLTKNAQPGIDKSLTELPDKETAVAPKEEPPAISDGKVYYKVQYKDQLTEISKKFYGRHDRWKEIYEANKDQISDPKKIYPGQRLVIPGVEQ